MDNDEYPFVLTAGHIAEIIGVSPRVAYELMERKDFPLIRIGRLKPVNRDAFFERLGGWGGNRLFQVIVRLKEFFYLKK